MKPILSSADSKSINCTNAAFHAVISNRIHIACLCVVSDGNIDPDYAGAGDAGTDGVGS